MIGSVASLPSLWPARPGRGVDAEVRVGVDDAGGDILAAAVNDRGIPAGASYVGPNSGDLAVLKQQSMRS